MKKTLVLLVALTMIVGLLVSCAAPSQPTTSTAPEVSAPAASTAPSTEPAKQEIVIGLTLMNYNFPFFQDMLASAKKTAKEIGDAQGITVKIMDFDGKGDASVQLKDVEDMVSALKVNAIFLNPVDSAGIVPAVQEANDANIPVITVDVKAAGGTTVAHVASDNKAIGTMSAQYAVEELTKKYGEAKGTVIMINYSQITSMAARCEGFKEEMAKYPNITLVEKAPVNLNTDEASKLGDDILTAYPEGKVDIVFGSNTQTALGMLAAVKSANRTDVKIMSVDNDAQILQELADPNSAVIATIAQNPVNMGKLGVEFCVKAALGQAIDNPQVDTVITLITKDNLADYNKQNDAEQASIQPYK